MVKVGDVIKVETKTKNNAFGTCYYRICNEKNEQNLNKCVMLGGGEAAKIGMAVYDSLERIEQNIEEGITSIVPENEVKQLESAFKGKEDRPTGTSGVIEY
jgi:hypothetical protein